MKRLAIIIGLALMLALGTGTVARATAGHHHPAGKKKKCKANWVFKKGKCRRVKGPHYPLPDSSPRDIVRATVSWHGNANVDLIVEDLDHHLAGYSSAAGGVVNEIPDATHQGDVGPGGGTETFIDHIWHPLYPNFVANRGFYFGACARDVVDPVTATLTFIDSIGAARTFDEHFDPPGGSATSVCGLYYG